MALNVLLQAGFDTKIYPKLRMREKPQLMNFGSYL